MSPTRDNTSQTQISEVPTADMVHIPESQVSKLLRYEMDCPRWCEMHNVIQCLRRWLGHMCELASEKTVFLGARKWLNRAEFAARKSWSFRLQVLLALLVARPLEVWFTYTTGHCLLSRIEFPSRLLDPGSYLPKYLHSLPPAAHSSRDV